MTVEEFIAKLQKIDPKKLVKLPPCDLMEDVNYNVMEIQEKEDYILIFGE